MRASDTLGALSAGPDAGRRWSLKFITRFVSLSGAARGFTIVGLLGIAAMLPVWLRMIVSTAPQEMREGALLWTTIAFLHGQNPYAIDSLPGPANVYGPLYPLLVTPFAWVMGATLATHRIVNNLAIVAACGLLYRVLRQQGVRPLTALGGAAINLAGLLYWVGPTARPDGLGVLLLVGAYAVLAPDPASPRRFATGLGLSLLGLATKIYYVLPAVVALAWLALHVSWRRSLGAAAASAVALLVAVSSLAWLFPAWASIVLGANLDATHYEFAYLLRQSADWAIFSLPLLVALASGAWRRRLPFDLWTLALLAGSVAIAARLGGHRGAHMTYFFHLVTPPLTVVALRLADTRHVPRLAFAVSLVIGVWLNAHWFTLDVDRFARAERTFATLAAAIAAAEHPTATGEMAPLLLAARVDPIESGHTQYFHIGPAPWFLAPFWGAADALSDQERRFTRHFYKTLDGRGFDLIIANRRALDLITPQLLYSRYRETRQVDIDMPWARQAWPVDIWVPTELTVDRRPRTAVQEE